MAIEHRWDCPVIGGGFPRVNYDEAERCRCIPAAERRDQLAAYHVHIDIRRYRPAWYFPPPFRVPEGTDHPWAVVKRKRGKWMWRRRVPYGYLNLLCRMGLHFITRYAEFQIDGWACQCRRDVIPWEAMRR